jgi:hypothetical protein
MLGLVSLVVGIFDITCINYILISSTPPTDVILLEITTLLLSTSCS